MLGGSTHRRLPVPFLIFGILFSFFSTAAATLKGNKTQCDCFRTSGTTAAYFQNYRFFDYRNIPAKLAVASDPDNGTESRPFFSAESWTDDWDIQTWNNSEKLTDPTLNAKRLMVYSKDNVYIERSKDSSRGHKTHLTLRTTRTPEFQSAAEIDSVAINYQYLSLRLLARVTGAPGGCAGIFTWYCPNICRTTSSPDVQEADMEFLTRDPLDAVHFTNQPSESPEGYTYKNATTNTTLPEPRVRTDWNEYRYDWLPGLSTWYVNGEEVASIAFNAPRGPAGLIFNMWSSGGAWTGNMSMGESAYLQIQWVEVAFNTSEPVGSEVARKSAVESGPLESSSHNENRRDEVGLGRRADGSEGCKVVCRVEDGKKIR